MSAQAVDSGKLKALETTLANLNKKFGEGVVMKLGDTTRLNVESIPTGSLSLSRSKFQVLRENSG
ncbi:DNA recombination/repair protein RecA [Chloroflexi bacterium TSY]|nr:DNA recombination/repair protein RecA [Chloroflexi bacterium TSY]